MMDDDPSLYIGFGIITEILTTLTTVSITFLKMPRSGKRKHDDDDDDDDDDDNLLDEDDRFGEPMFSQLPPEASQSVKPETESHRKNLDNLNIEAQEKHLVSISRLILFRGLEKEPIDRLKVTKDAGIAGKDNIGSAAFQEASRRLRNVFGFELNKIPKVNIVPP